ncbi:tRNA lysidine(34) synthetase TilS [Nocardia cyriacigeorgica]|uniref:tRNA(Ile)-lysidine synthase n=1 Tax=Nocardia cyriacigeorgica TaxID=135487 RepID=A0A6P1DCY1_9NOCA|nr:tRNA lysidine(34) synthetase TilS [Nocardia cyriacigeorgica]NEW42405.1 tRNA lysidine(34) synthetase TilS [Nocardia cyriacigeorgica]NEW47014.1 tRNA lysidine(34) synthetase TilS [Nocardia cyriacigeorgica]NEW58119.1 tRNA lysidine(34) synthetase TilS [Nocardia cyriacigeorgica]
MSETGSRRSGTRGKGDVHDRSGTQRPGSRGAAGESGPSPTELGPARLPETPAVLELRHAVRSWSARFDGGDAIAVALSGGADSLALTSAAVVEIGVVDALIVDHRLQPGSAQVAAEAAATALKLGCRSAHVLPVEVGREGGMEAAARKARYAALDAARDGLPVLLGHTLDDQAETVLLGLARGSGPRSIQGMAPYSPPWGRPLLGVRRTVTRQFCADLGLTQHEDPHNDSPEFTRVRLRSEVLPLLEQVLGGGVAEALGRTAGQLREDNTVLDELANDLLRVASHGHTGEARPPADTHEVTLSCETLATAPAALRRRAIRAWLLDGGAKALTGKHLQAVDQLVTAWRGQGGVAVGGGEPGTRLVAAREHGRLTLAHTDRVRPGERE